MSCNISSFPLGRVVLTLNSSSVRPRMGTLSSLITLTFKVTLSYWELYRTISTVLEFAKTGITQKLDIIVVKIKVN